MYSKILITENDNIDYNKMCVIDNNKIEERIFDSHLNILQFENIVTKIIRNDKLINVSVYDDLIILNDKKYKILKMLSSNNFS